MEGDEDDEEDGGNGEEDQASRSTISAIVLDEAATVEEDEAEDEDDDDDGSGKDPIVVVNDDDMNAMSEAQKREAKRARLLADYAKARIPKPPLAEANFVMKRLSDDDQAYMRRALLIGLERGGKEADDDDDDDDGGGNNNMSNVSGRSPNELARLARGEGHRFTVRQIASAGMKDGSVTFPLGSVNVRVGSRCRFFVRDGDFAKKEVSLLPRVF